MIGRTFYKLHKLLRFISRSEWLIKIFKLSVFKKTASEPGLLLFQIDCLSYFQLQKALDSGKMPFLKHLLDKNSHILRKHYTGMPCTTPGVQAELFFGKKTVIPSFGYYDREREKYVRLFDPFEAERIEKELIKNSKCLLKGGTSYSNIYTGNAEDAHFCISGLSPSGFLKDRSWLGLLLIIALHFVSLIKVAALMVLEFFIALIDFISGLTQKRSLLHEITLIPSRVGMVIMLRELITIAARIDAARGMPIISANFMGFHEQSHRRGASSKFAHWTLKGIDRAIKRIYKAAKRSGRRDYQLWIFSDHGQEDCLSYESIAKQSVTAAVRQTLSELWGKQCKNKPKKPDNNGLAKFNWTKLRRTITKFAVLKSDDENEDIKVSAMGPMGQVYTANKLTNQQKQSAARELVNSAAIPSVLYIDDEEKVRMQVSSGNFVLLDSIDKLFPDQAFKKQIAEDLDKLCRHRHSGDLIISGYSPSEKAVSFRTENGSHGSMGADETTPFTILTAEAPLENPNASFHRPIDLRNAALKYLSGHRGDAEPKNQKKSNDILRIMTYNIHSCIGVDGKLSPARIARVIDTYRPDIVALQEVDISKKRTGHADQPAIISKYLNMDHHFHPSIKVEQELYGQAILSIHNAQLIKADLITSEKRIWEEPRAAVMTKMVFKDTTFYLLNTHLGLTGPEKLSQTQKLLSSEWLGAVSQNPCIICGDFNSGPRSKVYKLITEHFEDAQKKLKSHNPKKTWMGHLPVKRLDHIFLSSHFTPVDVIIPRNRQTVLASDHLPLIVDLKLNSSYTTS